MHLDFAWHADFEDVIESPASHNGRVQTIQAIGHSNDQYLVLSGFRNTAQELRYLFNAMLSPCRTIAGRKECIYFIDHYHCRRHLGCLLKGLGDLLARFVDERTTDTSRVD